MTHSYNELMDAVYAGNRSEVIDLVNQGLDLSSVTSYGKTALTLAASKGFTSICMALINDVKQEYKAQVNHKDGNRRFAVDYAEYLDYRDTFNALMSTSQSNNMLQIPEKRYVCNKYNKKL